MFLDDLLEGSTGHEVTDSFPSKQQFIKSAAEVFISTTLEKTKIWGNILSRLSAEDAASSLKVCKSMRSAIANCLASSAELRHKTDAAAAVSATDRGRLKCTVKVQFSRGKDKGQLDHFCAIDNLWIYGQSKTKLKLNKVIPKEHAYKACFKKIFNIEELQDRCIAAFPAQGVDKYFVRDNLGSVALVEWGSSRTQNITSVKKYINHNGKRFVLQPSEKDKCGEPYCVTYGLFRHQGSRHDDILMALLNNHEGVDKCILLHIDQSRFIAHTPSNEEVNLTFK